MPLPDFLQGWCASNGLDDVVVLGRAINPCVLETFATLAAGLGLLITVLTNVGQIRHAATLKLLGQREKGPQGVSGVEFALASGAIFIGGIHLLHSLVALSLDAPYHVLMHLTLLISWTVVAALTINTSKVHVVLDFRPTTIINLIIYVWSLETYWSLYKTPTGFPLPYTRATIWSLMLQSVVTFLLVYTDFRRHKRPAYLNGYQRLPDGPADAAAAAGTDVEGGPSKAAAAGPKMRMSSQGSGLPPDPDKQMSWLAIFWQACVAVWPETFGLQVRAVTSFGLLFFMRALNLLVPILYKKLVDSLNSVANTDSGDNPPWAIWGWLSPWVAAYLAAVFFQGGLGGGLVGAINNLRQVVWIPVGQDAYRRISLRIFSHVMTLDLSFHLGRKTGEVTKQIDRGTNAMQNILSTIMFSIVPTCVDVLTASTYLAQALEPSVALTVFLTVGSYIPITIIITEWRGAMRREMNRTEQIQSARITDALLNYETVQYFTNFPHERDQYAKAIADYQKAEFKSMASMNLLNCVQSLIMWIGMAIGLLVCSAGVHRGELTVGDVVLFLSLMGQLYGPLNWFGGYYRTIQQYMIDMENLFQLLDKKSGVVDKPGAKDLVVTEAKVEYDSVYFMYERGAPVLQHVSFSVPGGQTVAFVGATGSGKSTVTRLMFRFYDVTSGAIRVDGVDIRDVTQTSLRKAVGMVPQDTVLFNDTIMTNIRYGCLTATDEEVYAAAEAASIHQAITTRFPRGYNTMVGERGLRLSGGEKQRVAFARALLKNPQILVLDEATSALDTLTERKIQAALTTYRSSRTTMIVAHRLSTIVDADLIVVMHLGQVIELGSHTELVSKGGAYAELWNKQLTSANFDDADPATLSRPALGSGSQISGMDGSEA